jgi:hypothetical protein
MAHSLEQYLASLTPPQAETVCALRALVLEALPEAREEISEQRILYAFGGPICVIRAERSHVELLFPRAWELVEDFGIPPARHLGRLKIHQPEDLWPELFKTLIRDAGELNEQRRAPAV